MPGTELSPEAWIVSTLPTKTVCGVQVVYNKRGYRTQYYSTEWLAETFGDQIKAADNPLQQLIEECDRRGYTELQSLISAEAS